MSIPFNLGHRPGIQEHGKLDFQTVENAADGWIDKLHDKSFSAGRSANRVWFLKSRLADLRFETARDARLLPGHAMRAHRFRVVRVRFESRKPFCLSCCDVQDDWPKQIGGTVATKIV